MHSDLPITTSEEDCFERISFAKHLAGCLVLTEWAPSIVVGIEGNWGEGKTSCINLVREELAKSSSKPIIVEYTPWLISTIDSLIEGFFVQLAISVGTYSKGKNAQDTARKVLQFAKMLAPIKLIPGAEPWASIVENVLSSVGSATQAGAELANLSLDARKKELQDHLAKLKRPIVVIVDDVDRLSPEHIRTVFQMLKAIADFPRVAYLAAYDPEPVAKALSYNEVYDGRAYLEKIVQISYPLPRLSFIHRKEYLKRQVEDLLTDLNVELSTSEATLWKSLLNETDLVRLLDTPRDTVRLLNRLRLTVSNTRDEVCFPDVVAFETLELKHSKIAQVIRREPEQFIYTDYDDSEFWAPGMETYLHLREMNGDQEGAILRSLLDDDEYSERDQLAVKSLLTFMFLKLGDTGIRLSEQPENVNRISQRESLLKLLHSGLTSFTYSSVTARRFLSVPEERNKILDEWREMDNIAGWLSYAGRCLGLHEVRAPEGLCQLLLQEARVVEQEPPLQSISRDFGRFLYKMINGLAETTIRIDVLRSLIRTPHSLAVSHWCLLYFLEDAEIFRKGVFCSDMEEAKKRCHETLPIPHEVLYSIKEESLENVRLVANKDGIIGTQRDSVAILYRWGQLNNNNYDEVRAYIAGQMNDVEWLAQFTKCFNPGYSDLPPFLPEDFIAHLRANLSDDAHARELVEHWSRQASIKKGATLKENEVGANDNSEVASEVCDTIAAPDAPNTIEGER